MRGADQHKMEPSPLRDSVPGPVGCPHCDSPPRPQRSPPSRPSPSAWWPVVLSSFAASRLRISRAYPSNPRCSRLSPHEMDSPRSRERTRRVWRGPPTQGKACAHNKLRRTPSDSVPKSVGICHCEGAERPKQSLGREVASLRSQRYTGRVSMRFTNTRWDRVRHRVRRSCYPMGITPPFVTSPTAPADAPHRAVRRATIRLGGNRKRAG